MKTKITIDIPEGSTPTLQAVGDLLKERDSLVAEVAALEFDIRSMQDRIDVLVGRLDYRRGTMTPKPSRRSLNFSTKIVYDARAVAYRLIGSWVDESGKKWDAWEYFEKGPPEDRLVNYGKAMDKVVAAIELKANQHDA